MTWQRSLVRAQYHPPFDSTSIFTIFLYFGLAHGLRPTCIRVECPELVEGL